MEQPKHVFKSAFHGLQCICTVRLHPLSLVEKQLGVCFLQLLSAVLGPLGVGGKVLVYFVAVVDVVSDQLVLRSVSHVFYLGLYIAVNRLQELVLLVHYLLFVQQPLHGFVVTLLGVEGKLLELILVLLVVQNGLREHVLSGHVIIHIVGFWPSLGFELHGVKHVPVQEFALVFFDVLHLHSFEEGFLSLGKELHLLVAHPGEVTDLRPPPHHVVPHLLDALVLVLFQEEVFSLSLGVPKVLFMLLSHLGYRFFVVFAIVFKRVVYITLGGFPQISELREN